MAIQIVTGKTGEPHLDIYEVSALLRAICGDRDVYITAENNHLSVTADGNSVVVESGGFLLQGAYMRVPKGQTATATGTLDVNSNEAILYVHYEQDVNTGIDTAEFRLYIGSYEDFISDFPLNSLESSSKIINTAIWQIRYNSNGNQSELINISLAENVYYLQALSGIDTSLSGAQTNIQQLLYDVTYLKSTQKRQISGTLVFVPAKAGTYYNQTVTFPNNYFKNKPKVVLMPLTAVPHRVHASVTSYSKNGFTATFMRDDTAQQTSVTWIATE